MKQLCQSPGYEEGSVDVLGARVHYLHAGVGRPVLLMHGLVGSSANWRRNIAALAQHASVYAIDQVNMGKSQRVPRLAPDMEAAADRVAATMTALGLEQADIVGHSHGGAVALMLAARHPQRVRSLVLFAPANPFSRLSDGIVRVYSTWGGRLIARAACYLPNPLQRFALGRMYGDPTRVAPDCLPGYINGLRIPGTVPHILAIVRCWFADMARLNTVLPQVGAVPTLLVWGDRDRAVSLTSAVSLNAELPESELVVVPGGGHILFEELPDESNRILIDWLHRDLESRPPRFSTVGSSTLIPQPRPASFATRAVAAVRRLSPES